MKSVPAIILAAGSSRRLGRPKQTVMLGSETLLERAMRLAREAGLSPVTVVVADPGLTAIVEHAGGIAVRNEQASEGMASSIRCGIGYVQELNVPGAVIMTCDQPGLRPEQLQALCSERAVVTASGYAGGQRVPAYFPATSFPALLALSGDHGARELLHGARAVHAEGLGIDVDTEEDVLKARTLFEHDACKG